MTVIIAIETLLSKNFKHDRLLIESSLLTNGVFVHSNVSYHCQNIIREVGEWSIR